MTYPALRGMYTNSASSCGQCLIWPLADDQSQPTALLTSVFLSWELTNL